MKIRKFVVALIFTVGLISVTLSNSFAKDSISSVTSPMPEPVPSLVSGSEYDTVTLYYVVQWNAAYAGSNSRYLLYEMICRIPHGSTAVFNIKRQQTALFFSGDRLPPFTRNIYDILTGSLLESNSNANFVSYGSVNGLSSSYGFTAGYFPENNASSDICAGGFGIVPDGISITGGDSVYNSAPFVTWSLKSPDHNIYHSHLSEPEWDKYNRYFVVDDKLFWISIRLNGFYVKESDIEGSTGYYQYEAIVPAQGGFDNGYAGALAQYSGYIPVNLSSSVFYDDLPFSLCLVPDTEQWAIRIQSNPLFNDIQTKVDFDLFVSEFNLEDGSYINSSFTHETQDLLNTAQYVLSETGVFSSVHCYGIDFYNFRNLPINLSDVDWEYDLEFAQWRDNMLEKLTQIYNLLSASSDLPETTTSSFGSSVEGLSDPSYSEVSPEQVGNELNNAWVQNPDIVNDSGYVKGWISDFSIPKLIALCVLALASGTVILTLGKNKADS